jgi:Peptidase family C25/Propeptide_C25
MGKKVVCMIILGLVITAVIPVATSSFQKREANDTTMMKNISTLVLFSSPPQLRGNDGFIEIQMDGATTYGFDPTKPVLPIFVKTYQIPFGSTNIQVVCQPKETGTMALSEQVIPARTLVTSSSDTQVPYVTDPAVYGSSDYYPDSWFRYDLGAGRNENDQQVTFVKVICYPVRYSPLNNEIMIARTFELTVHYTEPPAPLQTSTEEYDMVIIAPEKFSVGLQPLIDLKNSKGVLTKFKSVESILSEYDGFDAPEQIKKFIKNEYDTANITYVLLVGGLKSHLYAKDKDTRSAGWKAWWVPVRYVSIPHEDDEACLSDLYYGCLYNATAGFDSWDSNDDGVYAAWGAPGASKDTFDLYPEVYVGRLPVTTTMELKHIVKKIIAYENTGPAEKPWYKTFVGVGGKTGEYYAGKPDGEYLCDLAYNNTKLAVSGLQLVKVYSTNRDTGGPVPDKEGIAGAVSPGAGFLDMEGHGSTSGWDTIWFDGVYPTNWVGGLGIRDLWRVQNGEKQPIVVIGGCHNALYNVSMIQGLKDKEGHNYFAYGVPLPFCFCWALMIKPFGGAIAITGSTGYGVGYVGYAVSLSAELETNFFYQIGHGSTHVAQAHSLAIQKFIVEEDVQQTEAFVITNWALLADPSLMLGGYSS